jgi:penicillin amidase
MALLTWTKRALVALLLIVIVLAASIYFLLRGSLPVLDGAQSLQGLSQAVQVSRDDNGTVTITAANDADSARALGYVHAQERYFEMDLLRRSAAGELSALFGEMAVEKDKSIRIHRLRARIREHFAQMAGKDAAVLQAYADGVNAGLADLSVRPWPYLLLSTKPEAWQPEDSFLVGYAMFFDLQDEDNMREYKLWQLQNVLPAPLNRLLMQSPSQWDAPLSGGPAAEVQLPGPEEINLNDFTAPQLAFQPNRLSQAVGSNNFAVSGALTADGRAIVADDMHLGLRVPNIWFRARLLTGTDSDVSGFTLPGIPAVIVGSNRHVAWGFTNSYGDYADFVRVAWLDAAQTRYRDETGKLRTAVTHRETIAVKGGRSVAFDVKETHWGPITQKINPAYSLALLWAAQQPGALNLNLGRMAQMKSLDEALALAQQVGIPGQNLVMGDASGRIAWRMTAQLPNRVGGCDKTRPLDPALGCSWNGWLPGSANPSLVDPADGRLWTANARTVDGEALNVMGNGGFALGARAKQIRDGLFAKNRFTEADLLAIQTDNRAIFLARWWQQLQQAAEQSPQGSALRQLVAADPSWDGAAEVNSVSYRMTRAWRLQVSRRIEEMLLAPAIEKLGREASKPGANGFDYEAPGFSGFEDVAWAMLQQQPKHLLTRNYADWPALLEKSAEAVIADFKGQGPLAQRTWGERNTASICHPLAAALPGFMKSALCMPDDQQSGDADMPLVAAPGFGASQRMVVSPGREEDGIIHMPGGQSGHFMSPFWGAGHNDWIQHKSTPFLPGKSAYNLHLTPLRPVL